MKINVDFNPQSLTAEFKQGVLTAGSEVPEQKADFIPPRLDAEYHNSPLSAETGIPGVREIIGPQPYEGPYEATPTRETQVFSVKDKYMTRDFVVNPIPKNYGLITYNGIVLTVS